MNCFHHSEKDSDIFKPVAFNYIDLQKNLYFQGKTHIPFQLIEDRYILIVQVLLVLPSIGPQSILNKVQHLVLLSSGLWHSRFMNFPVPEQFK